ncbi:hypothetical protein Cni_G29245 [Canna indica]|uniref:Uncharacterized protein n=1 Tax=Canna indica TaxID=4628 RepID=A0AAQ3L509_9LILI|nr:hypothetical protein Cni_G29245 [Canna indica]
MAVLIGDNRRSYVAIAALLLPASFLLHWKHNLCSSDYLRPHTICTSYLQRERWFDVQIAFGEPFCLQYEIDLQFHHRFQWYILIDNDLNFMLRLNISSEDENVIDDALEQQSMQLNVADAHQQQPIEVNVAETEVGRSYFDNMNSESSEDEDYNPVGESDADVLSSEFESYSDEEYVMSRAIKKGKGRSQVL